jgi:hypothetical protein
MTCHHVLLLFLRCSWLLHVYTFTINWQDPVIQPASLLIHVDTVFEISVDYTSTSEKLQDVLHCFA